LSLELATGALKRFAGSQIDAFNNIVIEQTVGALWKGQTSEKEREILVAAAITALAGVQPRDELEGMLGAQLVATHNAAMECYRRAMIESQTFAARSENLNQANKLVRSYATLIEALDRHRGKVGQQHVTVKHVHIHQGGQAIVGTVHPGGGVPSKTEERAHAPASVPHERGTPMRRPNSERPALSVASGAEPGAL
jgi:hypothetical protein